jgi:hypothetical protein
LTIAWRECGESFDSVGVDEQPDRVVITVRERFGPSWTEDGIPIEGGLERFGVGRATVELARPLGKRPVVDGATGRAPDDLSIWQYQAKETRAQVLAARL